MSQTKEQALRENEFLRGRVAKLEAALQADVKKVQEMFFRGVDRLAQAQQVVVSSISSFNDIVAISKSRTTAYEASRTVVPCPGCKSNRTVMVGAQKVRLHKRHDCPRLQEEIG